MYNPGSSNSNADALSRNPCSPVNCFNILKDPKATNTTAFTEQKVGNTCHVPSEKTFGKEETNPENEKIESDIESFVERAFVSHRISDPQQIDESHKPHTCPATEETTSMDNRPRGETLSMDCVGVSHIGEFSKPQNCPRGKTLSMNCIEGSHKPHKCPAVETLSVDSRLDEFFKPQNRPRGETLSVNCIGVCHISESNKAQIRPKGETSSMDCINGSNKPHICPGGESLSADCETNLTRRAALASSDEESAFRHSRKYHIFGGLELRIRQVRLTERAQRPSLASSGEKDRSGGFAGRIEGVERGRGCLCFDVRNAVSGSNRRDNECPNDLMNQEVSSVLIITDSCITYSKDTISMGKSRVVNFISTNCTLNSPVNKELIDAKILDAEMLRNQNLPLGHVTVIETNSRYVFNITIRNKTNDKPCLNIISGAISRFKQAIEALKVSAVKVAKVGNDLDEISWTSMEQIIRQNFSGSGLRICVCSG